MHKSRVAQAAICDFKFEQLSSYGPYITFNTNVNGMCHRLNVEEIETGSLILLLNLELVIFVSDEQCQIHSLCCLYAPSQSGK